MISALFLSVVVVAGVALPQVEACRYWCDNPNTDAIDYVCCDDGNPWYRGAAVPDDTDAEDVEVVPAEVANDARPSGCMYYCLYNNESYCCHSSEDGAREYINPHYNVPPYPYFIGPHAVETPPYIGPQSVVIPPHKVPYVVETPPYIGPHAVRTPPYIGPHAVVNSPHIGPNALQTPPYIGPHAVGTPPYIGPSVVETLPPGYMPQVAPGYESIYQPNPYGLFRIVDTDSEEETPDSETFPFDISSLFSNPLRTIFNSEDETGESSRGFDYRRFINHVIDSPTLGRLAFDSLMDMIPSGTAEERIEASKTLDESNLAKRHTDNVERLNTSSSSINIFDLLRIPVLGDMSSLFFGNGEDDNSELTNPDIPKIIKVPLIISNNPFSGGVPLIPSDNSLSSLNPSDASSISNGVPLIPSDNYFSSVHPSGANSMSNGVPLSHSDNSFSQGVPLITSNIFVSSPHPSDANSISNGVPLLPEVNNSFISPNPSDMNSLSNGVPLIPIVNSFSVSNTLSTSPNFTGVPLPLTRGQANTAFVMKHVLQQHEMANAVMHSQQSPTKSGVSTKGSHQVNIIESSPVVRVQSSKSDASLNSAATENSLNTSGAKMKGYPMPSAIPSRYMRPNRPFVHYSAPNEYPKPTYNPSSVSFTPGFIRTGSDTPGLPTTSLTPPPNGLSFFSHIPASLSDKLAQSSNESLSADNFGKLVTDDVLDLVMNINKATCLCVEKGARRTNTSCPCSMDDLVVVFPPAPLQPYLLLPLSKSESFVKKNNHDKINKSITEEELISSPPEYSIRRVSGENKLINVKKGNSEIDPEQRKKKFLIVLKRYHNLSDQINRRTLADILGNSSKLPKIGVNNDQIEDIIKSQESTKLSKAVPSTF